MEKYRGFLFNGKNFGSWKFRNEVLLHPHDLKEFIENDLSNLCAGTTTENQNKLTKKEM